MSLRDKMIPASHLKHAPYTDASPSTQYEGMKAKTRSDMALVESCLGKCSVNFASAGSGLNSDDSACMSRCFNKYFNCALVTQKELSLFTVGMNSV